VPKFHFVLVIHAHQPVGNFENVFEQAWDRSYRPFLDVLERHPAVHAGLHYSGPLIEWFGRTHPEFLERLRMLSERGQVELIGGGFYEPILAVIPPTDRVEQIRRMAEHLESITGRRPRGAWLAERVWEPGLPSSLASAGVEYTLVDDNHFSCSGFESTQLYGYYIAEDCGSNVQLIPGLKSLRYLIPYQSAGDVIASLREAAAVAPGGMAAMGDDCEKFGVWPRTYDHCYTDGWLEGLFAAIEENSDWLEAVTPSEALAARPALGRADLPATSYSEMSEWSLPTEARKEYHRLLGEFSGRRDLVPFLRGGFWRNFLTKYPESNLLHKRMIHVSRKIARMAKRRSGKSMALDEARTLLLQSQCNDAYWHGVFGGLYSPHLRTALLQALVRAEALLNALRRRLAAHAQLLDFDADGRAEILFTSPRYAALLSPADGATFCFLDFRSAGVTLVNSLMRRPEAYHERLSASAEAPAEGVVSIHDQVLAKEPGLDRLLKYDRWARHAGRLLLFGDEKTFDQYHALQLEEDAAVAGSPYCVSKLNGARVALRLESSAEWEVAKVFSFHSQEDPTGENFLLRFDFSLSPRGGQTLKAQIGLELVLNLLAANDPSRYFESGGERYPLNWAGIAAATELRLVDEWQGVAVSLVAPGAQEFWVSPIETVSQSEEGFERVYQGSQILAVWPFEVTPHSCFQASFSLRVSGSKPSADTDHGIPAVLEQ
jgi:hypothetical protein